MLDISLKRIEKTYGITIVLTDVTFEANENEKIGIIGANGCGKTTIFRIIAGLEKYDNGIMSIRKNTKIGYLNQIPEYPEGTITEDILNSAFDELLAIKKEMRKAEEEMAKPELSPEKLDKIMTKYGRLQSSFEEKGGYEIDERIKRICQGLKITETMRCQDFDTLSGGEMTRVELAHILLLNPDILLLDEPTNHLDIDSVEWFENYINNYKGTVLIISHDRYFLDKTVNKIIEIEYGKSTVFKGNYSYYVEEKDRLLMAEFERYKDQQKKIKAMKEAMERWRAWSNNGQNEKMFKKVKQMEKRLEKMEIMERPELEKKKIGLYFENEKRSGNIVIKTEELSKSFDGQTILNNIDFLMNYKEKICLMGKNGSGKSTFIKLLLGELSQDTGDIVTGSNVKVGYMNQEISFPNENETVLECFINSTDVKRENARGILAKFLFYGDDVFKWVKNLSGGEKVRLRLCQLMYKDINLLILDEPTNHLDIDTKEMLEDALSKYKSSLLFISHDRYFINKLANRVIEIEDTKLYDYTGNYEYYKRKKEKSARVIA